MSTLAYCPSREDYQLLLIGSIPASEQQPFLSHLEQCPSCAEIVDSLFQQDTLASAAQATPSVAEELPQGLIDRILAYQVEDSFTNLKRIGSYCIRERLGQGGMGIVFLADDPHLERHVALKVMHPKLAASAAAKQRFLREARSAAKVKSDYVVTIYQTGEEAGVAYVAMERLVGSTLGERLDSQSFTITESLHIARQMALGLAAAHDQGLVHRDIKPENVWLETPGNRVKLLDFGLARPVDEEVFLTNTGTIVGTPAYMAPEQAAGKRVDARSDLFSLGSVLYRLVTGKLPFPGDNVMAVLSALASQTPPSARSINPLVPPALDDLLNRLLQKDPSARPVSAQWIADELAAIGADPNPKASIPRRRMLAALAIPVLGAAGYFAIPRSKPESAATLPPYRELRLPPKATGFIGNFELDPTRPCTIETFFTLEADAFPDTDACHVFGNNAISLFGIQHHWNFSVHMLKPSTGPEVHHIHIAAGKVASNKRTHLAAIYFGPQLRLYQDGQLIGSENIGHDWKLVNANWFSIGGFPIPCRFSEVRVSTIARYTKEFIPAERHDPDEHTFMLWHLDETDGFIMTDSSGHARHGTNHSGGWIVTPR